VIERISVHAKSDDLFFDRKVFNCVNVDWNAPGGPDLLFAFVVIITVLSLFFYTFNKSLGHSLLGTGAAVKICLG